MSNSQPQHPNRQRDHREGLTVVLILAALFAAWHVVPALVAKDSPPLACQLAGGYWNIWSGWSCDQ